MGIGLGTRHQVVFLPAAEAPPKAKRRWPLYVALGAQLLLLAFLPGHRYAAHATGQALVLDVIPVDPVDMLRGRYVDLQYRAGDRATLEKLPGWNEGRAQEGAAVWLTLQSGIGPDTSWRPVAVAFEQPAPAKAGQVLLAGQMGLQDADFGIDRYHVDASLGDALDAAISNKTSRAEVRVDAQGHPALMGLMVGGKHF